MVLRFFTVCVLFTALFVIRVSCYKSPHSERWHSGHPDQASSALLARNHRLPTQMPCTCRNVQTSPQIAAQLADWTTKLFNPFINVWISHGETLTTLTPGSSPGSPFCVRCIAGRESVIYGKITEHPFRANFETRWLINFGAMCIDESWCFSAEDAWWLRRTLINLRIILVNKFSEISPTSG